MQEKERELELAKFATEEARIVPEEETELARMERQADKDSDMRIVHEVKLEKLGWDAGACAKPEITVL